MKVGAALALLLCPSMVVADELEAFRGRGIKDATRTPLVDATRPDWDYVFGRPPWDARANLAGAPTVEVRRNFVYVQDTDGTLNIPFQSNRDLQTALSFGLQQVYTVLPDEFVFIYLFTSFDTNIGAFFYAPLVNTDSGIGQQLFRQGRGGPEALQGYIFMNDWKSFEQQFPGFPDSIVNAFAMSVFNQEAGHRWGTQFDAGPGIGDGHLQALLGRDDAHWSYFANTGGSPLEGNAWRDNGNGTFTTTTDVRTSYNFADLDLYMMGLLPPEQVRPWFLISNPDVRNKFDMYRQPLGASSPPQIFDPMTVSGTRVDYTIDDVVSRLGRRSPAVGRAPTRFKVVFAMLASRTQGLSESQKNEFEGMVDMYANGFKTGARNLGQLEYVLNGEPAKIAIGQACPAADACESEAPLCTRPELGQSDICTRGCTSVSGCPVGFCCAMSSGGSNVCTPDALCPRPPPPDAGVADSGELMSMPDAGSGGGGACACDLTTACNQDCACDPECPCVCDVTTACDPGCGCDPDCGGGAPTLPPVEPSGCGVTGRSSDLLGLMAVFAAAALLRKRPLR